MTELPEGWTVVSLKDIAKVEWGNTNITKKSYTDDGYPAFSASGSDGFLNDYEWEGAAVILSAIGARCGKCFLAEGKWTAIKNTIVIQDKTQLIDHRLLYYYLNDDSKWSISGSGQPFITMGTAHEVSYPFPPRNEQRRIAAKLETLLGRVDAAQTRLAIVPRIIKRFRQSVLASACYGQLTADWREGNPKTKAVSFSFESNDLTNNRELPSNWAVVRAGDIISDLKYGTSQKCGYEKRGVPVLRIPNIGDGVIDTTDLKYGNLPTREVDQLKLSAGDILLIRSNGSVSLVGKSALVSKRESGFAYAGYLIRLRANRSYVVPEFLNLALSSHDVRLQIEVPARSTSGVNNINSDEVRALEIGVPPIAEQQEIVRRVEVLFKTADALEARYRNAKAHVDKLTQSILAKAFRGELVPQDPNDEPASVLLDRIQTARAGRARKNRQRRET